MTLATHPPIPEVSSEEIRERVEEYRLLAFKQQAAPQVVYQKPHDACPWAGCAIHIAGIHFQLEKMGDKDSALRWLACWWKGPGLVGPCPSCKRLVLFELDGKRAVDDPVDMKSALLPDDWHQKAHLVIRPT
jgi:hypothetical protein